MTAPEKLKREFENCRSEEGAKELLAECKEPNVFFSIHEPMGKYLAASDSVTSFGYDPKELVGNSAYDYFHPEDFQEVLKSHARISIRDDISTVKYRFLKRNGSYASVETVSRKLVNKQGVEFLLALTYVC